MKTQVVSQKLGVGPLSPDRVKYEVAQAKGIQLKPRDNGELKTAEAGKISGSIGGPMVQERLDKPNNFS